MNLKGYIVGLLVASTMVSASPEELLQECSALRDPTFFDDMKYMASNSEICTGDCRTDNARVGSEVAFKVFGEHLGNDEYEKVKSSVAWALLNLETVIGDEVKLQLHESLEGEYPTKILIFPVTEILDRALLDQGFPMLKPMQYAFPHRVVLRDGGCSGQAFVTGDSNEEIVSLAYVFVSSRSLQNTNDLDLCLLEEITQTFGLFGDPSGNASLFDDGNVDLSGGRPTNSTRTNAMLRFLYSGNQLTKHAFNRYRRDLCH